ncbi:hypothetical protein PoB_006388100 [Plakobranchus ocellatus]|uniref:Biogenesis of lysosome-related organelles complex 1 subunit 5 n=1 Tax=Plakobranchus ocellatus TaxID=259542 RepID=A0AAV4CZK5_9GAST|nr:hypothetical protein PoB_006388100 [Plakobranchus ocellatus]
MQDDLISLSHCLNKAEKCNQLLYPATQEGLEAHIQLLGEAVNNTTWACQRILLDESEKKMDWLEQGRVRRGQEWDRFIQGQAQARIQHADNEFEVRADGLRRHYADLEERLSQGAVGRLL